MFSAIKRIFSKTKPNDTHEQTEPCAIPYDDFWNKFAKTYASFAIREDNLPKLDGSARITIEGVLKPIIEADTLKAQRIELRQIGQKIISHRSYVMAYCNNTEKFSSLEQYLSILNSIKVELPIENQSELISAIRELSLWYAVVAITAVVLDDYHENGWFQCYELLYDHHADQLVEHGEAFQELLNSAIKKDESSPTQANALSSLILLERFMEPFLKNNLQGEPVSYRLHSVASALEMKEYMKAQ
ncbi:hypothetical protein AB6D67_25335 [Vibrio splendidus]|nr:hypothetical protein DS893_14985 [Vibrionales bacterium C3R12]